MRLERPRRHVRPESPDVAQQLLAREDAVGVGRELHEQSELLRRQVDVLAVRHNPPRHAVDGERPDVEPFDTWRAAPQQRVDAREQLLVDERPREAVVRVLERPDARRRIRAAEDDDRTVGDEAAGERVGIAEEQHVGIGGARQLLGALIREDVEAVVAKLPLEEAAHRRLRFCENE